jgi:HEAT repeat protein
LSESLEEAKKQINKLKNNIMERTEENVKYKQILLQMRDTLNEVNLQNAKLLYTNQALGDDSLNERQRKTIAEAISKAGSVAEAKTIFEALQSTVGKASVSRRRAPKSLGEAVERRSITLPHNRGQKAKADHFSDRLKLLAGIK